MNLQNASYVCSCGKISDFIRDGKPQIAFIGRSNAGKSSVINCLLNRKKLAYVGNQPGKTINVNYYQVDQQMYFVDLPGYGFAKVTEAEHKRWSTLLETYFSSGCLSLGIVLVDARHKPTAQDVAMIEWFHYYEIPVLVIANKMDKLKKSEITGNLELIRQTLSLREYEKLLPFSALNGQGREALLSEILRFTGMQ